MQCSRKLDAKSVTPCMSHVTHGRELKINESKAATVTGKLKAKCVGSMKDKFLGKLSLQLGERGLAKECCFDSDNAGFLEANTGSKNAQASA